MRKFFAAAAVTVALLPTAAQAKVPVLDLGDICHFMAVVVDQPRVSGFSHFTCQTGNFVGLIAKAKGAEGRSMIGSLEMRDHRGQYLLQVDYPLLNGGAWKLYYTKHGYTAKVYQSGTYTVIK